MPALDGIDVSQWQDGPAGPLVDWDQVATMPLRFVMARMTHGGRSDSDMRVDTEAIYNRDGMRRAMPGVHRGYYHFLGCGTPTVQAAHFARTVGPLQPGEFIMLDVEPDGNVVPTQRVDQIVATLEAIEREFGVTPFLYIGAFYPGSRDPRLSRFPLWLPAYTTEARYLPIAATMCRPVTAWQWGGADIPGILRPVDANRIEDIARFEAACVPQPAPPAVEVEPPAPPAPSPAPPAPVQLEDRTVIVEFVPQGSNATFFGVAADRGPGLDPHVVLCWWSGDGNNPAVQAYNTAHASVGARKLDNITLDTCRQYLVVLGKLPADGQDGAHNWAPTDFFSQVGG